MSLLFKILSFCGVIMFLYADICAPQNQISGSVNIDKYKAYFKQYYRCYNMNLRFKNNHKITTRLDDDGNFLFLTSTQFNNLDSIFWSKGTQIVAKIGNPDEIDYLIWPPRIQINTPPPYHLFSFEKFDEVQLEEIENVISKIQQGDYESAKQNKSNLMTLYKIGEFWLGKTIPLKLKLTILSEVCHSASRFRSRIGISNYPNEMIKDERLWLREFILMASEKKDLSSESIDFLIVALNDWAQFSRIAYSEMQRRWPNCSLAELPEEQKIFREEIFKNMMSEDLLLVEEVFSDDDVISSILSPITKGEVTLHTESLLRAIKLFPDNVNRSHEELKFAELSDLFNALNQIRRRLSPNYTLHTHQSEFIQTVP